MKKVLMLLSLFSLSFLCGCEHIQEIENNQVITACIARVTDNGTAYGFFVSVPNGSEGESGGDSGSKSSAKLYEFEANNFYNALKKFEDSGIEKADVSHMSLLAGDMAYFKNIFTNDEEYIRKCITSPSLVYTCILQSEYRELVDCLNSQYNSKADDFAKNVFESNSVSYNCTLSELSMAQNNMYYTAAMPAICINSYGENKLAKICGTAFFSAQHGISVLTDNEHEVYTKWRKGHDNESDCYELSVENNILKIKLKDSEISHIATKYSLMNVDILNVKYYSKKCFLNYKEYDDFINNYNLLNSEFSGGV